MRILFIALILTCASCSQAKPEVDPLQLEKALQGIYVAHNEFIRAHNELEERVEKLEGK